MGGFGSGGWNRTGRLTTANLPSLDVNRLKKSGALQPGFSGFLNWVNADGGTVSTGVSQALCFSND